MSLSSSRQAFVFSMPLSTRAHAQAIKASQQYLPYLEKVEASYSDQLALHTVQYYLRLHQYPVETVGENSLQSSHYLDRALSDGAILELSGYGSIACLSLAEDDTHLDIPVYVFHTPIVYMAVELDDDLSQGSILGYIPQTEQVTVSLDELQPLSQLPSYLAQFNAVGSVITQLSQWWERSFNTGWDYISELTSSDVLKPETAWNLRSSIPTAGSPRSSDDEGQDRRTPEDGVMCQKMLEVGEGKDTFALVLVMERFVTDAEPSVSILIRLSPNVGQVYLPTNIQMIAADESDYIFSAIRSREHSQSLELRFRADPGDYFSLRIVLADATLTEGFVV